MAKKRPSVSNAGTETKSSNTSETLRIQEANEEANLRKDNRTIRKKLIWLLASIASGWLVFTAVIVTWHGSPKNDFMLSDPVMIAFLTNTLGIVLGLWGFGLKYFFSVKN